jgi:hypothetical protein
VNKVSVSEFDLATRFDEQGAFFIAQIGTRALPAGESMNRSQSAVEASSRSIAGIGGLISRHLR